MLEHAHAQEKEKNLSLLNLPEKKKKLNFFRTTSRHIKEENKTYESTTDLIEIKMVP